MHNTNILPIPLKKGPQWYSQLAFLALILAFVVMLFGAYTRLTNAGLSCPDWPRCYGYLTPPLTSDQLTQATQAYPQLPVDQARAWTEMRHRYLAGLETILIFAIVSLSWYCRKKLPPLAFKLSQSLIVIMLGQILLGMLTVTALLKPIIVLGHLLFGFTLISILWVIGLLTQKPLIKPQRSRYHPWITIGLILVIVQIILGGWVSTHAAGLACIDFPYCNGSLMPNLKWTALNTDMITIHMLHRIGAVLTFSYLLFLSIYLIRQKDNRRYGSILLSLLCLQIILGILNILWLRPLHIALAHHAIAALLLLTMLATLVHTYYQKSPS